MQRKKGDECTLTWQTLSKTYNQEKCGSLNSRTINTEMCDESSMYKNRQMILVHPHLLEYVQKYQDQLIVELMVLLQALQRVDMKIFASQKGHQIYSTKKPAVL